MIQILKPDKDRKSEQGVPCSSCREKPSVIRIRIGEESGATSIRLCECCRDDLVLGLNRMRDGDNNG